MLSTLRVYPFTFWLRLLAALAFLLADGTTVGEWKALGHDCQKWSFRR